MNGKRKQSKLTLILRTAAGAYLLWLAWGLREAVFAGEGALYPLVAAVFLVTGIILLISAVPPLVRKDYLDSGETEEAPENDPDGVETTADEPEETARDDETE